MHRSILKFFKRGQIPQGGGLDEGELDNLADELLEEYERLVDAWSNLKGAMQAKISTEGAGPNAGWERIILKKRIALTGAQRLLNMIQGPGVGKKTKRQTLLFVRGQVAEDFSQIAELEKVWGVDLVGGGTQRASLGGQGVTSAGSSDDATVNTVNTTNPTRQLIVGPPRAEERINTGVCAGTDRARDVDLPRHNGISAFCDEYARIKVKKGSRDKVPPSARRNIAALCAWVNRRHYASVLGFNTWCPSDRMRVVRMLCSDVGLTDLVPAGGGYVTQEDMYQLLETVATKCEPSEGGWEEMSAVSSAIVKRN